MICPKCGKEFSCMQAGSTLVIFCHGEVIEYSEYDKIYGKVTEAKDDH